MIWSSIIPSFLASLVECVEALTIVLVVGVTINWRSSLWGAAAAFAVLAILIAVFGAAVVTFVPIRILRLIIGSVLLLFGLQWLLKAVLRYSGLKARHDEALVFERQQKEVLTHVTEKSPRIDGFGFVTSFKAVLLEGLEIAFIVVSFGTSVAGTETEKASGFLAASLGALLAAVVVAIAGLIARRPLTKIPENTLKYVVGILITSFGTYWAGEGLGLEWPLSDFAIVIIAAIYLAGSAVLVALARPNQTKGAEA